MKLVLAAMCAIVVLFAGGCAVVLLASASGVAGLEVLAILPGAVALLNLLIIGGLYGWGFSWRPAFYILGIIDLLIAAGTLAGAMAPGAGFAPGEAVWAWAFAAIVGAKGILSVVYGNSLAKRSEEPK